MSHAEACLAVELAVGQTQSVWLTGSDEGYYCSMVDDHLRILVGAAQTDGRIGMAELRAAAGGGPPLHRHPCAEAFYVVSGSIEFIGWSDGALRTVVGEPGAVLVVPGNAVHTFRGGPAGGSAVALATPATIEVMFRQGGEPLAPEAFGRFDGRAEPDLAKMFAAADAIGLELLDPATLVVPDGAPEVQFYPPGSGDRFWLLGDTQQLITADAGTGVYLQTEAVPPGCGTPPHTHPAEEFFYVLEGEVWFLAELNGSRDFHRAVPGTLAYIPGGALHCFQNRSDQPAKFVMLCTDDQMQSFFREVGLPLAPGDVGPQRPPTPAEVERVLSVAVERYGMTFPQLD